MYIETITSSERDSEVCVSCPQCGASEYFDPRPGMHCGDCEAIRQSGIFYKCPFCGPQTPTGDVEWLSFLTGELTLAELRHAIGMRRSAFYRRAQERADNVQADGV